MPGHMLSDQTIELLEELANASDAAWQEGGLLFNFEFAYAQAGNRSSRPLQEALRRPKPGDLDLTDLQVRELGRFLQAALGDPTLEQPREDVQKLAWSLINRLRADLQFDLAMLIVEDGDTDMTASLEMVHRGSDNFYRLELHWSVD